jgi:hypothetical protein
VARKVYAAVGVEKKMKKLFQIVIFLIFVIANPALSADFQKGVDAMKKEDYASALKELKPLAEQGHPKAQSSVAFLYLNGLGVPVNQVEGIKWLRLAARNGDDVAQFNLGNAYFKGVGVQQDYVKSHSWYALAVAQGEHQSLKKRDEIAKLLTPEQIAESKILSKKLYNQQKNIDGQIAHPPSASAWRLVTPFSNSWELFEDIRRASKAIDKGEEKEISKFKIKYDNYVGGIIDELLDVALLTIKHNYRRYGPLSEVPHLWFISCLNKAFEYDRFGDPSKTLTSLVVGRLFTTPVDKMEKLLIAQKFRSTINIIKAAVIASSRELEKAKS